MNRKIRGLSAACVLSLTLSLFSGCVAAPAPAATAGASETTKAPAQTTAAAGAATEKPAESAEPVTLRVSWWGGDTRHQATLAAIDAYTAANPNVTIESEYMAYDGYQKKLLTQIAGGAAPDVFQNSPAWFTDIDTVNYVDLNEHKDVIDISQFNSGLITENTFKGKLQALSAGVLATTTLINKDFFAKYGIPEDTVWTFEKVIEVGKAVHAQDPNVYLTTGDLDVVNRLWVYPYLSQKTGDIWIHDDYTMAFDRDVLVRTMQYVKELYDSGTMEPVGTTTAFIGKMEQNPKWIKGEIGMIVGLTSGLASMMAANPNATYAVADIPLDSDAKQSANPVRSSVVFSINSASEAIPDSAKFLNWLLNSDESAMLLLEQRGTPASDAAREVLVKNDKLNPLIAQAMEIASKNPGKIPNAPSENAEIWQINKDVITEISFGKLSAEQGADKILKGFESKLAELKAAAGQ